MIKPALIAIKDLVKTYAVEGVSTQVLKKISLSIATGELVAIVGASGSGKSTLMNIIGLLDKADAGSYLLDGRATASFTADELAVLRNQRIGFVFQQFNLLTRFTAQQNVALPLIYRNDCSININERVRSSLNRVGMEAYSAHHPTQLSGGQQQRVAIARALVADPQVLLADEPTGALDSRTGADVMALFQELHQEGRTIIIVTHDERVAKQCTRQITLADGKIIADEPNDIL